MDRGESNVTPPSSAAYERMVWERGVLVTDTAPAQVLDLAASHMVGRGYAIESRQPNSLTFSHREEPNVPLGCFLLLLGLVPGVLYFLLAGGDRRTTLLATEEGEGCRVYVSGDAGRGQQELREWVTSFSGSVLPH